LPIRSVNFRLRRFGPWNRSGQFENGTKAGVLSTCSPGDKVIVMKKDIHPGYGDVIFMDTSTGTRFLIKSTISSKETATWDDGNEYPLVKVEISRASHPFYTGKMKFVDSAGRVEKFQKKYNWGKKDTSAE
jgi:large subunit ribosomal protein L31